MPHVSQIFNSNCDCLECVEAMRKAGYTPQSNDNINHPTHYTKGNIEPIDVIEDWKLSFCVGNALKYIARADHKGSKKEDLQKAVWYLQREIGKL